MTANPFEYAPYPCSLCKNTRQVGIGKPCPACKGNQEIQDAIKNPVVQEIIRKTREQEYTSQLSETPNEGKIFEHNVPKKLSVLDDPLTKEEKHLLETAPKDFPKRITVGEAMGTSISKRIAEMQGEQKKKGRPKKTQ